MADPRLMPKRIADLNIDLSAYRLVYSPHPPSTQTPPLSRFRVRPSSLLLRLTLQGVLEKMRQQVWASRRINAAILYIRGVHPFADF